MLCSATGNCLLFGRAGNSRHDLWPRVGPAGSHVAGVGVIVTNAGTNTSTPVASNDTGYYEANLLMPGNYRSHVGRRGFRTSIRKGIVLPVASRIEINSHLDLGSVSESVTVVADAPLLDTTSAASGRTHRQPNPVRCSDSLVQHYTIFARTAPGVQSTGGGVA